MYRIRQIFLVLVCLTLCIAPIVVVVINFAYPAWLGCVGVIVLLCVAAWSFSFLALALNAMLLPCDTLLGHYLEKEYTVINGCQKSARCRICNNTVKIGNHRMEAYTQEGEIPCKQLEKCSQCGLVVVRRVVHTWGETKCNATGVGSPCAMIRGCLYCSETETRGTNHIWGEPVYDRENEISPCKKVQICELCDARIDCGTFCSYDTPVHDPSDVAHPCSLVSTCVVCGSKRCLSIHSYPPDQDLCEYDLVCTKCGDVLHVSNHDFGDSSYYYETCPRCGYYNGPSMDDSAGYEGYH